MAAKKRAKAKIHIKASHKGELHKEMGIPQGQPIPESKLEAAKKNAGPKKEKQIVFAENAKHFKHK